MHEWLCLYLIFIILYLLECIIWLNRNSISIITMFGDQWNIKYPSTFLGNQQGGIIIKNAFPPLGTAFICQPWPISVSTKAISSFTSSAFTEVGRPEQIINSFQFDEIKSVDVISNKLRINEQDFVKCSSINVTTKLANQIQDLIELQEKDRSKYILESIEESLDIRKISKRIIDFGLNSKMLYIFCNILWTIVFVIAPLLIFNFGLNQGVYLFFIGAFILHLSVLFLFYQIHKREFPSMRTDRIRHLIMMSIYPPMSIRAHDSITRNLLDLYHPLAVASILCSRKDFVSFARKNILDLKFPIPLDGQAEGIKRIDDNFRQILLESFENFLSMRGVDINEFMRPDFEKDEAYVSFCPRCHCGYTVSDGKCEDCFGIELVPINKKNRKKYVNERLN